MVSAGVATDKHTLLNILLTNRLPTPYLTP
jgi:hypothetical protein